MLGDDLEAASGNFLVSSSDLSQYMRLDQSASAAINLFPQVTDNDKNMSLYGLLNKCKTAMGSRLLKRWSVLPVITLITPRDNS